MATTADSRFADLLIRVQKQGPEGYPVELTLNDEQELGDGYLAADILPWLASLSPFADGEKLFLQLVNNDQLRDAWARARGAAQECRIRLRIDPSAPELHTIVWETLRDARDEISPPLATSDATPFSRYLTSRLPHGRPTAHGPIRILVAVANPSNLPQFGLPAIDVAAEMAALRKAVAGLDVELTALEQPCTLEALDAALRNGYHVLHFIGHGTYHTKKELAVLYLANQKNQVRLVSDTKVARMFGRHLVDTYIDRPDRLRLVFLASCQTAKRSPKDAFAGLAPKVVAAGVPCVLAMQELVAVETAQRFAHTFYQNLLKEGVVDLACNQARAAILSQELSGATIPVLFMRLRNGQLFAKASERFTAEPVPFLFVGVPSKPEYLFGRDAIMAELVGLLLTPHISNLALEGLPGVGKTALAVALAYHPAIQQYFEAGILWATLGPEADVMSALTRWAEKLGLDVTKPETETERAQAIGRAIGARRMLLIVDDSWHLNAAEQLRCGGANCVHLVTTRDRDIARRFAGRNQVRRVEVLADAPAYALLQELAPEAWDADPTAAQALIKTVGHLPLAIEMLGGYLTAPEFQLFPDLARAAVQSGLAVPQARLQLAQQRLGQAGNLQQTLQETILLSLHGLPSEVVQTFYALGAFAPKPFQFDRAAALAVTDGAVQNLALLVFRNLVEITDGQGFALHQVIADVARTQTSLAAIERHRSYYLELVNENREDWQRIEQVYGQIKWAWAAAPDDKQLIDFQWALDMYQRRRGLWRDLVDWLQRVLDQTQALGDKSGEGNTLNNLGVVYKNQGRWDDAIQMYEASLAIKRALGDKYGEGKTLNNLGLVYYNQGRWDDASQMYEASLAIARALGDKSGEGKTLNNLGSVYYSQGRWDDASQMYETSLAIARALGDKYGISQSTMGLGMVYDNQGRWDDAIQMYEASLAIYRALGDKYGEGKTLNNLGVVYDKQGRWDDAIQMYEASLAIAQALGDKSGESQTLNNLGSVYYKQGRWDDAIQMYEASLAIAQALGDKYGESNTLNNLGSVYDNQGRWDDAIQMYEDSLAIKRALGDKSGEGNTLTNLGLVYNNQGRWDDAIQMYEASLAIARALGDKYGEGQTLNNLGLVYYRQGRWDDAIQMYEDSLAIKRALGDKYGEGNTLNNLGIVYSQQGEQQKALAAYQEALTKLHPDSPAYKNLLAWLQKQAD